MNQKRSVRMAVIARDGRVCTYCGVRNLRGRRLHLDHVIPVSKGGVNTVGNLVVACSACNSRKNDAELKSYVLKRLKSLDQERATLLAMCKRLDIDLA